MLIRHVSFSLALLSSLAFGQGNYQAEYKVYREHPRLWLEADRLERLRKDSQRNSERWLILSRLIKQNAEFPEEPLLRALQFQVTGNPEVGRQAAEWALAKAHSSGSFQEPQDLRLGAIVFDWCQEALADEERLSLATKLGQGADVLAGRLEYGVGGFRSAVLASLVVSDQWPRSAAVLEKLMEQRWKEEILPSLERGEPIDRASDLVALLETFHALRYNLEIDLWREAPKVFRALPLILMLSYYPEPFQSSDGLFRWPAAPTTVKLDPAAESSLKRIAEMLLVAYENSFEDYQFLQGWLRHDSYTLTTPFGAVYEFLWLNPYLPGLSYFSAPAVVHDEVRGRVFARSGWQDDDLWVGYLDGQFQIFADGERHVIARDDKQAPLSFPGAAVVFARVPMKFKIKIPEGQAIYLVGFGEGQTYSIKVNKAPYQLYTASRGGIVTLRNRPESRKPMIDFEAPVQVRVRPAPQGAPSLGGKKPPSLRKD